MVSLSYVINLDETIKDLLLDLKHSSQLIFEKFFISSFYGKEKSKVSRAKRSLSNSSRPIIYVRFFFCSEHPHKL